MGAKGRKKAQRRQAKAKAQRNGVTMLRVTYPNGRTERVPDDGRSFPKGTMLAWDEVQPSGHAEMRWCVTGGGWPFDD